MSWQRTDYPEVGRALINETGSGYLWKEILRADFKQRPGDLQTEHEFGCIDAPATLSAGSHKAYGHNEIVIPIPTFIFR